MAAPPSLAGKQSIAVAGGGKLQAMFVTEGMQQFPELTWLDRSGAFLSARNTEKALLDKGLLDPATAPNLGAALPDGDMIVDVGDRLIEVRTRGQRQTFPVSDNLSFDQIKALFRLIFMTMRQMLAVGSALGTGRPNA